MFLRGPADPRGRPPFPTRRSSDLLLTGETKPDAGPIAPSHPLFGDEAGRTGFGAWELKFRFADLQIRSEEHTSELQSHLNLVCRLLHETIDDATGVSVVVLRPVIA